MSNNKTPTEWKMRISFDLDEVLFVSPKNHKTERPLRFPYNLIYRENLRFGTPGLISELQNEGYEVWVYTSSFRSQNYIRRLFKHYGVKFDGIINAQRHNKEVQSGHTRIFPQKMPQRYHISLHIDDEENIIKSGRTFGFHAMRVYEPDDNWEEKVIEEAERVRRLEKLQKGQN